MPISSTALVPLSVNVVDFDEDPVDTPAASSSTDASDGLPTAEGLGRPTSLKRKLETPERVRDAVGNKMLKIQDELVIQTERIADCLEEFLVLMKIRQGFDPKVKLTKDNVIISE